jgi:YHS domain-containing protein
MIGENLMFKRLATLSAAALLAAIPALAHEHGKLHDTMEAGQCPHHQAVTSSVDQALALLDEALSAKDPAQMSAKIAEARQQLTEAKGHMAKCQEMCSGMMGEHHGMMGHGDSTAGTAAITDPVCGMPVDPAKATAKSIYKGETYYFCSQEDKEKFDKDPEAYLKKGDA